MRRQIVVHPVTAKRSRDDSNDPVAVIRERRMHAARPRAGLRRQLSTITSPRGARRDVKRRIEGSRKWQPDGPPPFTGCSSKSGTDSQQSCFRWGLTSWVARSSAHLPWVCGGTAGESGPARRVCVRRGTKPVALAGSLPPPLHRLRRDAVAHATKCCPRHSVSWPGWRVDRNPPFWVGGTSDEGRRRSMETPIPRPDPQPIPEDPQPLEPQPQPSPTPGVPQPTQPTQPVPAPQPA